MFVLVQSPIDHPQLRLGVCTALVALGAAHGGLGFAQIIKYFHCYFIDARGLSGLDFDFERSNCGVCE